jgi:hypothetical protein
MVFKYETLLYFDNILMNIMNFNVYLDVKYYEPHLKSGVNSGVPEGQAVPAQQ